MHSASVGQQCADCVEAAASRARPGRPGAGTARRAALTGGQLGLTVTTALIAVNLALFAVELIRPSLADNWSMLGYAYFRFGGRVHGVAAGEWYRLITSAFLPPPVTGPRGSAWMGVMDIGFNMYALWIVGPALERFLGGLRFLGVYLLSAIGGSVAFYWIAAPNVSALGASGAIFGLFGAWFVLARRMRADVRGILVLIVINLVISFAGSSFIAWQDHLGGLLAGLLVSWGYVYAPRKNRAVVQVLITVAVLGAAIVAVVIRTGQLTG